MTHDYALSVDDLCKKSCSSMAKDPFGLGLEKATYYGILLTLKEKFNHPYDAKIYEAEDLALANKFVGANELLVELMLEYTKNNSVNPPEILKVD